VPGAMQALAAGDRATHDAAVARDVAELRDVELVLLAQFSMADAAATVQAATGARVLTSPDCAVQALRRVLDLPPA
jgi:hypothetical protein